MAKFFDDPERTLDIDVVQTHKDYSRGVPIHSTENGGISDEAYLADYRNRKPFHYVEEGSEGYYYWQYGATMEIEFEISDEIAFTDPAPDFVVDIRVNGVSIVNRSTGIADIVFGSMAKENKLDYYTALQVDELLSRALDIANTASDLASEADRRANKMFTDLYSMIGQTPSDLDNYTVIANIPFTVLLKKDQEKLTVNGTEFANIVCLDASNIQNSLTVPIADLPKELPFLAVYNTAEDEPRLMTGFTCLPMTYLSDTVIPAVETDAKIGTHNLRLEEEPAYIKPEQGGDN